MRGKGPDDRPEAEGLPARRRVNKDDVLRAATRLFAERGYEGLSMGDLAEHLGLRKASLFHHFPTKEILYAQVVGVLVVAVQEAITNVLGSSAPTVEKLDALSDVLTRTLGEHPHAARLFVGEAVHGSALMQHALRAQVDAQLEAAREFVRAGQREGVFDRELDPTHVVLTVVSAVFLPFALEEMVERFAGTLPRHPAFVGARTVAIREQLRRMLGVRA